jgi:hypothetical protein
VTSDSHSRDPFQPGHPNPPDQPVQPGFGQASGPASGSDPLDRPQDRPIAPLPVQAPVVRSRGGGMLVNVLLALALVVAVGGVAFAAGRATAPVAAAATGRTGFGGNGGGGFAGGPTASGAPGAGFGGAAGGVSVQGTVTAVSADSITIQIAGGQSMTIPIDAQTTYAQRTPSTASAVTAGSTVVVQLQGGRGAFGNGNGNGNGGQGTGPNASGAPGRTLGPASTITVVPPAS